MNARFHPLLCEYQEWRIYCIYVYLMYLSEKRYRLGAQHGSDVLCFMYVIIYWLFFHLGVKTFSMIWIFLVFLLSFKRQM